jgi:epoxyqueuosine reductase
MHAEALKENPTRYLQDEIANFVRESQMNRLWRIDEGPIWDAPLVGFADGDDPLFEEYKTIIGSYHLTPRELLQYAVEEFTKVPHRSLEKVSVISWILPTAERIRESNRLEDREPSEMWVHARHYGEDFNDALRYHIVDLLVDAGYFAMTAPIGSAVFERFDYEMHNSPTSNWSERHAAYAAGLGTFSLNDALITPLGMAMRCGSVVTNLPLPPSPRPYENHVSNCLYLYEGSCGECIARCPVGAITSEGHDKQKCHEYAMNELRHLKIRYGVKLTGCGLCQVGVPCEERIPWRGNAG